MRNILSLILAGTLLWAGLCLPEVRAEILLPPPISGSDAALLTAAFAEAKRGRWSTAHNIAARANDPLGAKILRWMDYSRPHNYAAFTEISAFIVANPDWPRQRQLAAAAETAMGSIFDNDRVLDWFRWRDPVSRDGRLHFANALITTGDKVRATKLIRLAWVENNFSVKDLKIIYGRFKKFLRPKDHLARLDRLVWDNRQRDARHMFRYVNKGHQALAQARMALRSFAGGVDAAIARVPRKLIETPGLMYERLLWRRRKGRDEDARKILFTPPEDLGRPKLWWRERIIQARKALNQGQVTNAYQLARNHGQIDSSTFAEAEWMAGWVALRFLGEEETAFGHFTRLYDAVFMPISRARAAYWAGRAAEAMEDTEGAELWFSLAAKYPSTFYGQLAAARIGSDNILLFAKEIRGIKEYRPAVIAEHEMFAVIRLLNYLGKNRLAGVFSSRLAEISKGPNDYALIANFTHSLGRHDLAIRSAKQATRDGYVSNERRFPIVELPFAYSNDELEHALVLALTRQESLFNTNATSHAGARGLMQLMPATARTVSYSVRLPYAKYKLNQPAYNVRLGSTYLAKMIDKYHGSYILALAAYNAGPSNVRRWLRDNGDPRHDPGVDLVDWIELITIPETRNYVQRVLEGLQVYRWQLGTEVGVASLEEDLARGMPAKVLARRCSTLNTNIAITVADLVAHC